MIYSAAAVDAKFSESGFLALVQDFKVIAIPLPSSNLSARCVLDKSTKVYWSSQKTLPNENNVKV